MEIIELEDLKIDYLTGSVVTIGNFDGVHLGHREIFKLVTDKARALGVPAVAITFEPHPREVLNSGTTVPDILPFKERCRQIREQGIHTLVWIEFTLMFAARSAEDFMAEIESKLHPKAVVIGHDFRFGRARLGDEKFLRERGLQQGFEVETVEGQIVENELISSTRIRELIQKGNLAKAATLLGQYFQIDGEVIHGHGRGKSLGFATANLHWTTDLIPPDGVYAAWAYTNGEALPAVVNIGTNPTFDDKELAVEAHILDLDGDLYARKMRLAFVKRLREEIKFSSADELVVQIKKDVARAREILGQAK